MMITCEINTIFCRATPEIDCDFFFEKTPKRLIRAVLNNRRLTPLAANVGPPQNELVFKILKSDSQPVDAHKPGVAPIIVAPLAVLPTGNQNALLTKHKISVRR